MHISFLNSLRFKVGFGYFVLLFINISVSAWGIYNFGRLTLAFTSILDESYPHVVVLERMAHIVDQHEHGLTMILNGDVEDGYNEFKNAKEEFYAVFDKANERRNLPDAGPIFENIRSTYEGYLIVSDSLFSLALRKKQAAARAYYGHVVRPFSQRLSDNAFWLIEENQKQMNETAKTTRETSDQAMVAFFVAAVLAIVLSVITTIQFTKRIIEPAEKLTETVNQIGRGRLDLKIDIKSNDEIGELSREFNKMTERLRRYEEMNVETLILEKQKSETIVESIADAIIVCDSDSIIQLVNASTEQLLSLREEDVVGKKIGDCIGDERILQIFQAPEKSEVLNQPYLQFRHGEKQIYLRPRISEIPSLHGGRAGIVLILQDVTQFKELDKMKSDFMAAVSHEFRTPLTSINMSIDILRQQLTGPLTIDQEELLGASKQDCERLTKLVKELLQLSKLESGKFDIREEYINIGKVIQSTLHPYQLQFKEKGVALHLIIPETLPSFIGDEQQFSWVISNLVSNALRYTGSGGSVKVSVEPKEDKILLQVTDTGRGILPEFRDKIFDKFVQIKKSLDTTPGSVGLGLAIVKEIVEMYGGKIWVESEINKGSTFSILLPVEQEHTA